MLGTFVFRFFLSFIPSLRKERKKEERKKVLWPMNVFYILLVCE